MATCMWKCLWIVNCVILYLNFDYVSGESQLHQLDESNWDLMLTGEWMVEFYAPWCPACKALQPLWEEYSSWSEDLGISVGQVDVTTSPGLSGRFMVTALPTIFHVTNGEFRQYRGPRDKESFMSFVEEHKWKQMEAIPSWKSPSSLQMSVVAHFFKLSQLLRAVHTRLMEDYGLPTWGSYLIFAFATIILGSLLGLLLVCIIEFIYPPKVVNSETINIRKGKKDSGNESEDDWIDEEIVDEFVAEDEQVAREEQLKKAAGDTGKDKIDDKSEDETEENYKNLKKEAGSGDEVEDEKSAEKNKSVRKRKPVKAD